MRRFTTCLSMLGIAVFAGLMSVAPVLAQNEMFIPLLVYRP